MDWNLLMLPAVTIGGLFILSLSAISLPIVGNAGKKNWVGWLAGMACVIGATVIYLIIVWAFSIFAGMSGNADDVANARKFMIFDLGGPYWLLSAITPFAISFVFQNSFKRLFGIASERGRKITLFLIVALPGLVFQYLAFLLLWEIRSRQISSSAFIGWGNFA